MMDTVNHPIGCLTIEQLAELPDGTSWIIYRDDPVSARMQLKPNTLFWRMMYWVNQFAAALAGWIVYPIARWNARFFRISEGETYMGMYLPGRFGMSIRRSDGTFLTVRKPSFVVWQDKGKTIDA